MDNGIDDSLYGNFGTLKQPFSPDLHLKTAIRPYKREHLLLALSDPDSVTTYQARKDANQISKIKDDLPSEMDGRSEQIYYKVFDPNQITTLRRAQLKSKVQEAVNLTQDLMDCVVDELFDGTNSTELIKQLKLKIKNYKMPGWLIPSYQLRMVWETVRDFMKDKQMDQIHAFQRIDGSILSYKLYVNGDYCLLVESHKTWVLDYSQVLMISDTLTTRFLSYLHCDLSYHLGLRCLPTPGDLSRLYKWGDDILQDRGNKAYAIIKQIEPVCISVFLNKWEDLPICTEYFSKLRDQMEDEEDKKLLTDLFTTLRQNITHKNSLFEIFGCYRHFGHPTVDEEGGIQSLKENTREEIPIDQVIMDKIVGAHHQMFILAFMSKQRRWPKCWIREGETVSRDFEELVKSQPMAASFHDLDIPIEDWSRLDFGNEFQFDDYKDITMLLSDTAISPYLHNWYTVFNQDLIKHSKPASIPESRRVLIELLTRNDISCKTIRETIQSGVIPKKWLVVALHSKERELKEKARLFAMMCIEMRLYFAMTEKNLAENIFPYIPYQTMTWSDSELMKVLLSMTGLHNSEGADAVKKHFVHAIISLDFNKFNQKWRYPSTTGIFKAYDQLFGTPGLYDFSHLFFQLAFFYLSSFDYPPDYIRKTTKSDNQSPNPPPPGESNTTWQGQLGGNEGLRQKGWTAIIVSALVLNQIETGIHSQIIGQGDNQVIVVSIPIPDQAMSPGQFLREHPDQITRTLEAFMSNLERITAGCGMDLKLEESWVSTRLMNYGKEIIFDGSMASNSIKKIGRAYQETSDLAPTLQNRVASIGTAAQSAAMKGLDCLSPYFINLLEVQLMIQKECEYGTTTKGSLRKILREEKIQLDDELMLVSIFLPSFCGGFPLMPFPSMFYRGHPDGVTLTLQWLKRLSKKFLSAKRILDLITLGHFFKDSVDPVQLIQDPQSVNFIRPRQSYNVIKEVLIRNLKEKTSNRMILDMMAACSEETLRKHAEYLFSVRPLTPRVLNEILRLSPDGAMLSFLTTFTDMRTMKQLMPAEDSHVLIRAMETADQAIFRHIIGIMKKVRNEDFIPRTTIGPRNQPITEWLTEIQTCSTVLAQALRDSSWKQKIHGVTTPHPMEQASLHRLNDGVCPYPECRDDEFILFVLLHEGLDSGMPEECFKRGPMRHYLGSGTAEKRSGPVLKFPKSEKPLGAGCQLYRARDWSTVKEEDNTLWDYITKLIESRTDVHDSLLLLIAGANYGGSIQHRFSDVTSKHESRPCIRPNINSRVVITSDQLGKYSRGKENYPIIFQACYLYVLNKIHHLALYDTGLLKNGPVSFHLHFQCETCCPIIVENPLRTSSIFPTPPVLKNCPLVFSSVSRDLSNVSLDCLDRVSVLVPDPSHPLALRRSSDAAAVVILGEIHSSTIPMISSNLRYDHRAGTLACLTVGFFCKIGLRNFLTSLIRVWICDNLAYIIRVMKDTRNSFEESCGFLLASYPDHVWNILKPFLCVKEVQKEAMSELRLLSTSTDLYITGRGLGSAISQCLSREIKKLNISGDRDFRKKFFNLDLLCNAPGVSMQRVAHIWMNSIFLSAPWTDSKELFSLCNTGRLLLQSSVKDNTVIFGSLVVKVSAIRTKDYSLSFASHTHVPKVSKVGSEPWIAPMSLPSPSVQEVILAPARVTSVHGNHQARIKKIMYNIPLVKRIPLSRSTTSDEVLPLVTTSSGLSPSSHTRSDHQYRLVGKYSTAALKYCQILTHLKITEYQAAVHLAEGAGGLCRMSHLIYNASWVLYASLFEVGESMGHRAYEFRPIETVDLPGLTVEGPHTCYRTGGDITLAGTQLELSRIIREKGTAIKLATCDAENPRNVTLSTCTSLMVSFLNIVRALPPLTPLIFKTFCNSKAILEVQVSLWVMNVIDPQILVPAFSSHESTEVFLTGKYKGSVYSNPPTHISLINKRAIQSLHETRRSETNSLSRVSTVILQTLYDSFDGVRISSNYYQAIHIFLGYCQTEEEIQENVLKACAGAIDYGNWMMTQRYNTMSKLIRAKELLPHERMRKAYSKKDSVELARFAKIIINANILRQILITKRLDPDIFLNEWEFPMGKSAHYGFSISIPEWLAEYGRSYHRIVGHLKHRENINLSTPKFLESVSHIYDR